MSDDLGPASLPHYTHGHAAAVLAAHARRTAADCAPRLLPVLRPGLDLLDVGCGPATITADLAEAVLPGRVVALDGAPAALDAARATLRERGLDDRVELVGADAQALPFADGSFDVVHAHQVLQHVAEPVAALREMHRAVRPGGLVAARDAVYSAKAWYPQPPALERWRQIYMATARANGGEPDAGSRLLSWFRTAGFSDVEASTSTWCYATPELRSWWGGTWAERCRSSFGPQAVELGLTTPAELEEMAGAWHEWAEADDGWFVVVHGEILARR